MARIHYLQHVPFEGLGSMEPWLLSRGHSLSSTQFFVQPSSTGTALPASAALPSSTDLDDLPSPADLDALIVMGGPMGIYEESEFPWLVGEKDFMRACLRAGKKVLGICLGAQLLADCLGAQVHQAPNKEIGWYPIYPAADSWVSRLFEHHPTVFHWHGDQFDIPEGATDILHTDANRHQAFHIGDDVIALQFHLEVTAASLADMILADPPATEIPEGGAHMEAAHQILNNLLQRWLYS